jgi:Na+/proline symporter
MTAIDISIIALYFVITMIVGLWMTRRASANLETYYLGGRKLPWWLLGIAGMTNWFDLTGTMIITSFLYMLGPRGLFIEFRGGAVLVLAFLLAYAGKWHRRSGCMTGAEWMTYRFGEGKAAESVRFLSAISGIIMTVAMIGYLVRGCSLFVGMFVPVSPVVITLAILVFATAYTTAAGFYGVVVTDLIQGSIIVLSCIFVGVLAWHSIPDAHVFGEIAQKVTGNADWLSSAPSVHTTMPQGYEAYENLLMFALFYLLRNILGGMGAGAESRYFAARSDKECGLQSLLQGFAVMFRWPMMIGFAVLGILLVSDKVRNPGDLQQAAAVVREYYADTDPGGWHGVTDKIVFAKPESLPSGLLSGLENTLGPKWKETLPLVSYQGTINPERILPAVLLQSLPVGLRGLLTVAMIAALMSCFAGTVNPASALAVRDIYQNFIRPKAGNKELIIASYIATPSIVAAGFIMGLNATNINDLWSWIIMSLGAGGLAPGLLRLYWWRCNAWGMIGGLALGAIGAVWQRIFFHHMLEWQQFLLMTFLSFLGTIVGSLITAPTSTAVLRNFYRTTRPFGVWGPLRKELPDEERRKNYREHRNDILAVPFALMWQVTLFLIPMQLVIRSYQDALYTLPVLAVGCAGMYCFWWRSFKTTA